MASLFNWRALRKSELLSKGEEDSRAIAGTHQGLIGHDAPVMSRILPDHNEHGAFEGHGKEDVTSKVSDPPFTNVIERSDNNKKPMLIR